MRALRFSILLFLTFLPAPLFPNTIYFPQVAFGGGYSTTFVLVNAGNAPISSTVRFYNQGGTAGQVRSLAGQVRMATSSIIPMIQALSMVQQTTLAIQLNGISNQASTLEQTAISIQAQISPLERLIAAGQATNLERDQLRALRTQLELVLQQVDSLISALTTLTAGQSGLNLSSLEPWINLAPYRTIINIPVGGSTRVTLPNGGPLNVGWAEVVVPTGTVEGMANLEYRGRDNRLVASSSVAGVEGGNSFVLPVESTSDSTTGIAIAGVQNDNPVNVSLRLLREDGSQMAGVDDVRLNPVGSRLQVADFVTGMFPELSGTPFKGTLVVEAAGNVPPNSLAAAGISIRKDAMSAVPVINVGLRETAAAKTLYFPQVVFGGGYSTTFTLVNTGSASVLSRFTFYDQNGANRLAFSNPVNLPPGGSSRFALPDLGSLAVMWGEFPASPGTVKGVATFELRDGDGTLIATEGLPAVEPSNSFRLPVDVGSASVTGIAIANVTNVPVSIGLRLLKEDGSLMAVANDARLNALGARNQAADFITNIFPLLPRPFKGTLLVEAGSAAQPDALVATAVNVKERSSLSEIAVPKLTALSRDLTGSERKVIEGTSAFSLALWNKLNAAQRGSNVFISPLSASFALGMTLNGAGSRNFEEMRSALQFPGASQQEINDSYRSLMALLTGLDPAVKMQIANSIWYRNTFSFNESFLETSKQYFDAEVRGMNFSDRDGTLAAINGWVDGKTNRKITSILNKDDINPDAVMFLINAIYFNGGWRDKFDPAETRAAQFRAADGSTQSMSLMHRRSKMTYAETSQYQAVDLPYGNSAFSMTVVLPKEGTGIDDFAASLTLSDWQSLATRLQADVDVDLSLPKLKLEYERKLNDDLKALGMITAFDDQNGADDFLRMSPRGRELYISFVRQKTFVDITEEGTEAAAVTAVGISVTVCACPPPEPKIMRVDRPYIFFIRERFAGAILFMGKIVKIP